MLVCKESLELSRRLISSDQVLYQEDLDTKFMNMQASLGPLIDEEDVDSVSATVSNVTYMYFLKTLNTSCHKVNQVCLTF